MISGEAGSPVFCIIINLSIHVALIYQELEVLHKHFISYSHRGYLGRGRKQDLGRRGWGGSKPKDFFIV